MNAGALYPEEIARHYYDTTHILPLQTKRGCSFRCAYCTYPALEGNTFRARDTHSIARELHELKARFPDVLVYFVDAVFNDPDGLFRDLLQTMIDQQCDVPFAAFLSPFRLDHADIDQMRRAGMICAELGIDASNDDALRGLNKAFSFQEAKNSCELLRRADISVTTNLIFGGPRETPATVRRGIDNVLSLGEVYSMIFSGVRILPKTPLWNLAKNEQKLPANWNGVDELYYFADGLDRETLDQTLRNAFEGNPYCIYPPHSRRKELQEIHKLGYVKLRALQRGGSQRTTVAPGEGGRPA